MGSSEVIKTLQNPSFRQNTDFLVGRAKRVPLISPRRIQDFWRACAPPFFFGGGGGKRGSTDFPPQNSGFLARLRALICFGGGGSKSNAIFPNLLCYTKRIFAIIPIWKMYPRKNSFYMLASPLMWKINRFCLLKHSSKNCAILPSEKIWKSFTNLLRSNLPKSRVVPFSII